VSLPFHIRNYKKKPKKDERQKLIAKLDAVFSEFIRLRDADKNGICKCITCGKFDHYTKMDAGHFVQRDCMGTRWAEENVNSQCPHCNRFRSGEQFAHGQAIDRKYKPGTASLLVVKGKSQCHWELFELQKMFEYYRDQVKILKEEKLGI
jgi:hypothetical protein